MSDLTTKQETKKYSCMRVCLLLICFLISFSTSFGQTEEGSLEVYLNVIISSLPGINGQDFDRPDEEELEKWRYVVQAILLKDLNQARIHAEDLGYQVTEFLDTEGPALERYYILEDQKEERFWGTYVFKEAPCRKSLILQAPHPKFDANTGKQAIYCFTRLSAAALFISGTHRCNHSSASSCSGTTSVCSSSPQSYRISDMAHNESSAFQVATEAVALHLSESVFVQLHGFARQDSDPFVIISNGSRGTPEVDYAVEIQESLLSTDESLTFKIGHIDQDWTKLLAFTNTQGRLLNESNSPCNADAMINSGRFIHIEQERSKLRDNEIGWNKMFLALADTFECQEISGDNEYLAVNGVLLYPNPFTDRFVIEGGPIEWIRVFDLGGVELIHIDGHQEREIKVDVTHLPAAPYIVKVLQNQNLISSILIKQP
jgi:hypothetical protein